MDIRRFSDYNGTKKGGMTMVYELYLEAVRTKVTRFEHASRLINGKELACAVGMASEV